MSVEQSISDQALKEKIDQLLANRSQQDKFSGSVLVARGDEVLFEGVCGLASQRYQIPNRIDTKFNLGSMNKMFTGVRTVQLAQEGKLDFQDTVGRHLPDYPNQEVAEKVTIHHLLTHTSGLGSYFNREFVQSAKERFRSIDDFLPLMVNEPLLFEPGTQWSYSNSGFLLLGKLIEAISGQSYFDSVREHIYGPAGMQDTDCYEMDDDSVQNLAMGYTRLFSPGKRTNNIFLHSYKGGPAGGGFSTVLDLHRFDQALRQHRLLNPEMTALLYSGKTPVGPDENIQYAYGFGDERHYGTRIVGHSGGFPGINSRLDMYLEMGLSVAIMSNYDPSAAEGVAAFIRKFVTGTPLAQPLPLQDMNLQPLLGVYAVEGGPMPDLKIRIRQQAEDLLVEFVPAMGMFEIVPLSENEYCDESTTDRRLRLQRDASGNVVGIELKDRREVLQFNKLD
jgi:CubicO group peptidase (beta-lactamase class C family)